VRWDFVDLFQDNFAIYRIDQQLRELSGMLPEYSVDGFDNCIEDDDDDDDEDYVDDGVFDSRLVRRFSDTFIFSFLLFSAIVQCDAVNHWDLCDSGTGCK